MLYQANIIMKINIIIILQYLLTNLLKLSAISAWICCIVVGYRSGQKSDVRALLRSRSDDQPMRGERHSKKLCMQNFQKRH